MAAATTAAVAAAPAPAQAAQAATATQLRSENKLVTERSRRGDCEPSRGKLFEN